MQNVNARMILCRALAGLVCASPFFLFSQTTDSLPTTTASTAAYGNCPAPKSAGVNLCSPPATNFTPSITSPLQVIAAGTGGHGPVKLIELWVDGKKLSQVAGNLFDEPVTLLPGTHQLTVVELDTTGHYVKSSRSSVEVVNSSEGEVCSAPGSPGVNFCSPLPNTCNLGGPGDATTTILATGTGASGKVSRMELWINGTKIANIPGDRINTNLPFLAYATITIVEVDSKGNYVKSTPVFYLGPC